MRRWLCREEKHAEFLQASEAQQAINAAVESTTRSLLSTLDVERTLAARERESHKAEAALKLKACTPPKF